MKKAIHLLLFTIFLISWSTLTLELLGGTMKKINLSKSDESTIKNLCKEYLDKFISSENQKELKTYYAKELWATGGEELSLYIAKNYYFKKIHVREIKGIGEVVEVVIDFHAVAEVDKNTYKNIDKNWAEQIWFVNENGSWKIKSIFSSIYFSREGAIKWANRFKNSNDKEFSKVAELILSNLK